MCLHLESSEITVGKGEIARNEQFLYFPQCFLQISAIIIKLKIIVYKVFQFGRVQNMLFRKGLITV